MSWRRLQNAELRGRLRMRSAIISWVREFFIKEGFLEVETPILVPYAGQEPYLNPMKVEFTTPNPSSKRRGNRSFSPPLGGGDEEGVGGRDGSMTGYLITSPEYAHKKMLAAGFEKTFEITRAFRAGESWGGLHNPEFTILEWYRANADYTKIMEDVERMMRYVGRKLEIRNLKLGNGFPVSSFQFQGKTIDLSSPWQRLTVREAFRQHAQVNLDDVEDEEEFFKIFLTKIERKLGTVKPTILYDYPASMASLARLKPSPSPLPKGEGGRRPGEGQVAERFEVYIAGIELANAFSELTDAQEQRRRFLEEQKLRAKLGKEIIPVDEDFLDAVAHMPPSAGIAFGVDRLVMLLTDASRIEDVLAFPASSIFPPLKVRGGEEGL